MGREHMFNSATRSRLTQELLTIYEDDNGTEHLHQCLECNSLSKIDMDPHRLTPDALIKELQQCSESLKQTCLTQPSQPNSALIKSAVPQALHNLTHPKLFFERVRRPTNSF